MKSGMLYSNHRNNKWRETMNKTYWARTWAAAKKAKTKAEREMKDASEKLLSEYAGENIETPSVIVTVRKGHVRSTVSMKDFVAHLEDLGVTTEVIDIATKRATSESSTNPAIIKVEEKD